MWGFPSYSFLGAILPPPWTYRNRGCLDFPINISQSIFLLLSARLRHLTSPHSFIIYSTIPCGLRITTSTSISTKQHATTTSPHLSLVIDLTQLSLPQSTPLLKTPPPCPPTSPKPTRTSTPSLAPPKTNPSPPPAPPPSPSPARSPRSSPPLPPPPRPHAAVRAPPPTNPTSSAHTTATQRSAPCAT